MPTCPILLFHYPLTFVWHTVAGEPFQPLDVILTVHERQTTVAYLLLLGIPFSTASLHAKFPTNDSLSTSSFNTFGRDIYS